jgi:hypothetical protein
MVALGSIPAGYRRMRSCLCFRQSRLRNKFFRKLQNVYRKSFVPGISRIFNLQSSKIANIARPSEAKRGLPIESIPFGLHLPTVLAEGSKPDGDCLAPSLAVDLVYKAPLRRIRMNPAGRHPGRAARTAL